MSHPMLLTEREWRWWFGSSGPEAARLVRVQQAFVEAGVEPCPDTVLGMSRTVLADPLASQRLRALADCWDRASLPPIVAEPVWPFPDGPTPGAPRHDPRPSPGSRGRQTFRCHRRRG